MSCHAARAEGGALFAVGGRAGGFLARSIVQSVTALHATAAQQAPRTAPPYPTAAGLTRLELCYCGEEGLPAVPQHLGRLSQLVSLSLKGAQLDSTSALEPLAHCARLQVGGGVGGWVRPRRGGPSAWRLLGQQPALGCCCAESAACCVIRFLGMKPGYETWPPSADAQPVGLLLGGGAALPGGAGRDPDLPHAQLQRQAGGRGQRAAGEPRV